MSATASPFVSILSSYNASVAKGSAVVVFESTPQDGCTSMIRIDLPAPPGLGNANRSVKSSRASPWGNPKLGPEKWCDMDQSSNRGLKSDSARKQGALTAIAGRILVCTRSKAHRRAFPRISLTQSIDDFIRCEDAND